MPESKMKEVAQLLGVELGEEFKIKNIVGTFRFEESGLYDNDSCLCTYSLKNLLTGRCEIEKPILDKVEKSYLENLLRPFKDMVVYVEKTDGYPRKKEYLHISFNEIEFTNLPYFKKNTMYKGMELGKKYTLKELGLFEWSMKENWLNL